MAERNIVGKSPMDVRAQGTPCLTDGDERRRMVLERKAQRDMEKHEKLIQKLTLVEDRRQAVIDERKKRALEAAERLNERLAQVSANRRQKEENDRMKRVSAIQRSEQNSERADKMKRRHTLPRSMSMRTGNQANQSPRVLPNGDAQESHQNGHASRVARNRMSMPSPPNEFSAPSAVQRSISARYRSAQALSNGAPRPVKSTSRPTQSVTASTLSRSKSQRVVSSSSKSASGTASSVSASSSLRTSAESKVKFGNPVDKKVDYVTENEKATFRRAQSVSLKRKPIPPREVKQPQDKPSKPAHKMPLTSTPKPGGKFQAAKPDVEPTPKAPTQTKTEEAPEPKEVSAAEIEFKKKLAEKRKMARENQMKKENEALKVTYEPEKSALLVKPEETEEKSESLALDLVNSGQENNAVIETESASSEVEKNADASQVVSESDAKSSTENSPRDGETEEEREEKKRRERELKVAERIKQMEAEREKERLKTEAENEAKLRNEEMERERIAREAELEKQRKQEEEERAARKAKLEAIMARTRVGNTNLSRAVASSIVTSHTQKEEERVTDDDAASTAESCNPTSTGLEVRKVENDSENVITDSQNEGEIESKLAHEGSPLDNPVKSGAYIHSASTTVEHESPGGSKIASPSGEDNLSPVPERHKTLSNEDKNFEQVILLNEENGAKLAANSDNNADSLPNSGLESSEFLGDTKTNSESLKSGTVTENDNAEHSQFPF